MPKLTDARRNDRRAQIADAAMRRFVLQGFANTSMADIIEESGLSAGSIYSHFDSKATLLRFVAVSVLESRFDVLDAVRAEPGTASPGTVMRALLSGLVQDAGQARVLLQVWAEVPLDEELAPVASETVARLRRSIAGALAPWIAEHGDRASDLDAGLADLVMSSVQGYVVRIALDPGVEPSVLLERVATALDA
jgi:AcrR family transcriptional regulator